MGRSKGDPLLRWSLDGDCWIWQGASYGKGYGGLRADGRSIGAHTYFYEQVVGPIPAGLYLDHLCRNRRCVNPDHLEPVTMRENLRRGKGWAGVHARQTHCKYGHPFTDENTIAHRLGRECRTCRRRFRRELNERRKAARRSDNA